MRATQDIAGLLATDLTDQLPAQLGSVRARYGLSVADLPDVASVTDMVHARVEQSDEMPSVQVEVFQKRPEQSRATGVEVEIGGNITVDRRYPARVWLFVRANEYDSVVTAQSYTALAIEEILAGAPALSADPTVRVDPTTVAYDLSDIGLDAKGSRSFGGVRFNLELVATEEIGPLASVPAGGNVGTADTLSALVTELARTGS